MAPLPARCGEYEASLSLRLAQTAGRMSLSFDRFTFSAFSILMDSSTRRGAVGVSLGRDHARRHAAPHPPAAGQIDIVAMLVVC